MYAAIWRRLPGPFLLRCLQAIVLLGAAVLVLFVVVFPRVERLLPYTDVTVTSPSTAPSG